MSATNRTENYNLPIFIETDKPAWLVDFNGAMRSIDAQMKLNAEAIATKSPILTFQDTADIDFTKTGDIITANLQSAITDKVGRALVTPLTAPESDQLVAINDSGAQEALEIGSGLKIENNNLKAIDLDLTIKEQTTNFTLPSGVTLTGGGPIAIALNSDRSIGKIYGNPIFRCTSGGRKTIETDLYVKATGEAYDIGPAGFGPKSDGSDFSYVGIHIAADGKISFDFLGFANGTTYLYLYPCIYFFSDFGDTPTP